MSSYYNAVFFSLRPITWLRIWGEMIIPAALAAGTISTFSFISFFIGFLVLGPIGWSALYLLNDVTDKELDRGHPQRKNRAVTSGKLPVRNALIIVIVLFTISLYIAFYLGDKFMLSYSVMVINQLLYTLPVVRLKQRAIFDVASNGVNSLLRFIAAWFTQSSTFIGFPWVVLLWMVCLKIVLFLGHRGQSAEHEKHLRFKSTASLLSKRAMKRTIGIVLTLSGIFYILSFRDYFPVLALGAIVTTLPFIPTFLMQIKSGALATEKNERFRSKLYLCFFLFMTATSLFILYSS